MSSKALGRKTVIDGFQQSGSYKCMFPRAQDLGLEAVLLNTAGGITGGDQFRFTGQIAPDTTVTLTTQACERVYKAQPGQVGTVRNTIKVGGGARLNWLPQETILYDNSALNRRLIVDLDPGAQALVVEPLIFGRQAMGETLGDIRLWDHIELRLGNQPLFLDAIRFEGDLNAHLGRPDIGGGAGAMALVILASTSAGGLLQAVRETLPDTGGASLIREGLMVVRILAPSGFALRRILLPVLRRLNSETLPRCWML